jgi:hypothetical protein
MWRKMNDIREILLKQHCPNLSADFSTGQPLARVETAQVIEADYTAIAPMVPPEFAALSQKMDAQNQFIAKGFEHLINQGQSFESRLTQLEQRQATPIVQYQPAPVAQYQQPDITPVLLAIAQQNQQTQLAMSNMAAAMQKISDRPTTINHFVDNTTHNDSHEVIIHGNNYGNICTDGIQKNGGNFLMFLFAAVVTMIIGAQIYGK